MYQRTLSYLLLPVQLNRTLTRFCRRTPARIPAGSARSCIPTVAAANAIQQQSDNDCPPSQPRFIISAHDDVIWRLTYLPDRRRVATRSNVWNLENGKQEEISMEHQPHGMNGFAVTWNDKKIIGRNDIERNKVWNLESHKLVLASYVGPADGDTEVCQYCGQAKQLY